MERSTLDLWVGLFVVAGVAALVILAMKVSNMSNV
jgi:phospholipid/cholesterol/gamma-HCH transport system substrate-binding protein